MFVLLPPLRGSKARGAEGKGHTSSPRRPSRRPRVRGERGPCDEGEREKGLNPSRMRFPRRGVRPSVYSRVSAAQLPTVSVPPDDPPSLPYNQSEMEHL